MFITPVGWGEVQSITGNHTWHPKGQEVRFLLGMLVVENINPINPCGG